MLLKLVADVAGWTGMVTVLAAYYKDTHAMHITGAILLGMYSAYYSMWPQVATNVIWACVAVKKRKIPEDVLPNSTSKTGSGGNQHGPRRAERADGEVGGHQHDGQVARSRDT